MRFLEAAIRETRVGHRRLAREYEQIHRTLKQEHPAQTFGFTPPQRERRRDREAEYVGANG